MTKRLDAQDLELVQNETNIEKMENLNAEFVGSNINLALLEKNTVPIEEPSRTNKYEPVNQGFTNEEMEPKIEHESAIVSSTTEDPLSVISEQSELTASPAVLSSRINPTPAAIAPIHFGLPTRKFVQPTSFCELVFSAKINEITTKAFNRQPPDQRPRKNLVTIEEALESPDAYQYLIDRKCWKLVAKLAHNDLISAHPIDVDSIMNLWHRRWVAMLKLQMFAQINTEMELLKLNDLQELDFDKFQQFFPGRKGPMVPFELLLLHARIPSFRGNHDESIRRFYQLLYPTTSFDYVPSKEQSLAVVIQLVNVLFKMEDYELAAALLKGLIREYPSNILFSSVLGRVYLQLGQILEAKDIENRLQHGYVPLETPMSGVKGLNLPEISLTNRGYYNFATDSTTKALEYFQEVLEKCPDSVVAHNNIAICHLYEGDVRNGTFLLEQFVQNFPEKAADNAQLLFNLTSMFDLLDSSIEKKRELFKYLVPIIGDEFDPDCLKF